MCTLMADVDALLQVHEGFTVCDVQCFIARGFCERGTYA